MQGTPSGIDIDEVRAVMQSHPAVTLVHDLHVWAMGSRDVILTGHVVVADRNVDMDDVRRALAAAVDERFGIEHSTLQMERNREEGVYLHR